MKVRLLNRSILLVLFCFGTFVDLEAQTVDLSDGLVAYYPMEGDLTDASGNGYDGTTSSPYKSGDRFLNALSYSFRTDNNTDELYLPAEAALRPATYTVNIWFNISDWTSNGPYSGGILLSAGTLFRIGVLENDQGASFEVYRTPGPPITTLYGQDVNGWTMATLTFDGTSLKAYLNGKLEDEEVLATAPAQGSGPIVVGSGFEGVADDMRIYNRALNAAEVKALHELFLFPEFSADVQNGVEGLTVNFSDQSTADGTLSSWEWHFGDGTTSTAQNPSHTYTEPGVYHVTLKASDGTRTRSISKRSFVSVIPEAKPAATITAAEYFFDEDPGVGNGTAISLSSPSASFDLEDFTADASGLTPGFHFLHVRAKSNNGSWSAAQRTVFYVQESLGTLPEQATKVMAAEYFFDEDPGVGNGTAIDLSAAASLEVEEMLDVTGLSPGFHRAFIRVKNDQGLWSASQAAFFYVQEVQPELPAKATQIVAAEYYFDEDPGLGQGTSIPLSATDAQIHEQIQASASGLALGEHTLNVRVKDDKGIWSDTQSKVFQVAATSAELLVNTFEVDPASVAPNTAVSTSLVVENSGDANVAEAFSIRYYFSEDQHLDVEDQLLATHSFSETLQAAASTTVEKQLTVPADLAKGTYYLLAELDSDELIFESDETNNLASVTFSINNAPVIAAQEFSLPENSLNGAVVGTVAGTDADGDALTYSITAGNTASTFAIEETTGTITVADSTALDYESTSSFSLTVVVSDGALDASAAVIVSLTDVAENAAPVIEAQSFSITESSAAGTLVGTVAANDPDEDALTYTIVSGNSEEAFTLDAATGDLTVADAAALDQATTSYELLVEVSDGALTASATITVSVTAEENQLPVIAAQSFTLAENSLNGATVGTVAASDPDGDELSYSITGGNTASTFAIGAASGEITIADSTALDYEQNPVFTLTVEVADGRGGTASAAVSINLTDVDEEEEEENAAPVIEAQSFTLAENSEEGTIVGKVLASDPEGETVNYSITDGNTQEAFAISPATGQLIVNNAAMLDYESTPEYSLTVEVTDGELSSSALITISLTDEEEQITGIEDELKEEVMLYPNPTGDYLQVEVPAQLKGGLIQLYSLKGAKLGEYPVDQLQKEIDLRSLKAGMYLLQISNKDLLLHFKVMKTR